MGNKLNIAFYIILIFTFLYSLDPFSYGFIFGYLLSFYILFNAKNLKPKFDRISISLLFFSISYSLFYAFNPTLGTQFILIYAIIPVTFYMTGKLLYQKKKSENFNTLLLILIGAVISLTSMISVALAIIDNGYVTIKRNVPIFWTGIEIPATNMASFFVMNMCIPGLLIIGFKNLKNKWTKIILIIVYLFSLICVMRLGSRTHIAITLFAIGLAILYRFKKQDVKKNFIMFSLLFLIINLGGSYLSIKSDSDLFAAYADRMDSKTNGVSSAGGRFHKWEKSINYMFKKPLGWDLDVFGYAHNLWFDTMRVGGMISFILLLIFTILSIKSLLKLFQLRSKIFLLDGQLLIYSICFLLVFFVEPILEGYFIVFTMYCIILGFLKSHFEKLQIIEYKE